MSPRVVSLLLAFVMLWSAIAVTQQRFGSATGNPAQGQHLAADESGQANFSGSIAEHQIDDQPSQPHGEHVIDVAALLDTRGHWNGLLVAAALPLHTVDVILPSPHLEGPQRPPRATSILFA
jgi:hypothetical protein